MPSTELDFIVLRSNKPYEIIIADETRLKQILINLIGNSIKFTESGGINLTYKQNEEETFFIVQDTGIGIEAEQLDDVFTPFLQLDGSSKRKYGGTGLGLSISKEYIEIMGGKIQVESEGKDKGTKVSFTLPNRTNTNNE